MSLVQDGIAGARLLARLPVFPHRPVEAGAARGLLARRLEARGATFLEFVQRAIFDRRASPYARLLRHAGCEDGDLERLVRADGVERALHSLLAAGVYLTVDELRGRRPIRRGPLEFEVAAVDLRNPLATCQSTPVEAGPEGRRSAGILRSCGTVPWISR